MTPTALRRQRAMMKGIGWLMSVAGTLLVAAIPVLMFLLARLVNRPTLPGSLPPYSGTHADTVHDFLLLGLTGVVGCLTLANGIYTVRHLRQSRFLAKLLLLSFGVLIFVMTTGSAWLKNVGLQLPLLAVRSTASADKPQLRHIPPFRAATTQADDCCLYPRHSRRGLGSSSVAQVKSRGMTIAHFCDW